MLAGLFLMMVTGIAGAQVSGHSVAGLPGATNANAAAVVRNAPFSAEVVTLYDRALDNGGHIHRETRGEIYRDSQGRMRTESETPPVQPGTDKFDHVTISDPVQRVIINLNRKTKTATIFHLGRGMTAPITTANVTGSPVNVVPVPPGLKAGERSPTHGPVETRTESLGNKYIEGVNAVGTRMTRIIDAGSMGNDKPIVSVTETWFSPELKMTVLTENDDGQSGHSTMKLIHITHTEPIAQLFQVPSDYTVKDTEPATASVKH